ncbi:UDP-N-acetylmuramoyl-L-alanine--D-glutamate ligase [Candidatus Leptofilum sp.]|uniref:UDP-N-acetylmuramoyl-L-alanine--D-glutamate ligase n=1 Tax=Candidatus Leptofilum sp. TaxID=3241576 RepID=UPI003B592C8A
MDELAGRRLLILGLARQGKALARFATEAGAAVTVTDLRSPEKLRDILDELQDLNIRYVLGEHPMELVDEADILAVSGGVPLEAPLVQAAQAKGIPITNDSLEFSKRAPTAVIGITGSAGKTTTTALTGVMSQVAGRHTWVGGNIGQPLIADLHKMEPEDVVVQELSSFQLEIWDRSPHIATVLNITPNHLDRHKTMKAYTNAKANILRHQTADDIAVLCADNPGSLALSAIVQGQLRLFSLKNEVTEGAFVKDGRIVIRNGAEKAVCRVDEVQLRGRHNLLNVLAATTLADSAGIPAEAIAQAIRTFTGVEHRLELVRTRRGVQWINDSIATAPERAMAAVNAFSEPLILLAGGKDKAMEWEVWAEEVTQRVKTVILFGDLADMLAEKLAEQGHSDVHQVRTVAEAVELAAGTAVSGDIVLLSPGGTSFDAFDNFAERGELFRQLVNAL